MYKSIFKNAFFLSLAGILFFSACSSDGEGNAIDEELQPYFDRFIAEAELRDMIIDLESKNIKAILSTIIDSNVLGKCVMQTNGENLIIIDDNNWNSWSDLDKEFVIFHELGHCYLDRGHFNEVVNGMCVSLMNGSAEGCEGQYNLETREEYIDELFNP